MVESAPSVMKKATSKASTTTRARRLCAGLGGKLARKKCRSSGTTAAVFTIGATLRSGCNARHEAHTASPLSSQTASGRRRRGWIGRIPAAAHVIGPVTDFRTLFSVHRSGSPRLDWSPSVASAYLICGALVSIYEATGLARPDVAVTFRFGSELAYRCCLY